jgi:16S rRNA (guanine966-N2)-methyltransferase
MRIIAGKYRGRRLKSPPSLQTRPTSDRLRETLFNILAPRIEGVRFLDLCAGTGAVGIEALSRGAAHVTLVDQSRKMCALIETNLDALKVDEDEIEIVNSEALVFLQNRVKKQAKPSLTAPTPAGLPVWGPRVGLLPRLHQLFDIIFFDPPYAADYEAVLDYLGEQAARLLAEDGMMIVEHDKKKELAEKVGTLRRYRLLKQGDSQLSFYNLTG